MPFKMMTICVVFHTGSCSSIKKKKRKITKLTEYFCNIFKIHNHTLLFPQDSLSYSILTEKGKGDV